MQIKNILKFLKWISDRRLSNPLYTHYWLYRMSKLEIEHRFNLENIIMNREEIEQGMKCCNEFLCGECPYGKYDDKVSKQYTMRCIHMLMQDINKLYFEEETKK